MLSRAAQRLKGEAYLASRGIAGSVANEAIDTFKLGFANRTLGLRLPEKNRLAGAEIRTRLQKIGIYRESGHEHFNGSLIVPILSAGGSMSGHVVEVYGRKLRDDLRAGTPKHLYLPTREGRGRGVFNVQALATSPEIILCEALIDALTFWCAGYRNVTSAYAQFLTFPDQTTRLRRDHEKYLTLIDVIAFLHQHQREIKTHRRGGDDGQAVEYIEATLADIALAARPRRQGRAPRTALLVPARLCRRPHPPPRGLPEVQRQPQRPPRTVGRKLPPFAQGA